MTIKQESKLKMIRVVISVFVRYATAVNTIQALADAIEALKNILGRIEALHPVQSSDMKGITDDKDHLREELRDQAMVLSGMIYSYAVDTSNQELATRMDLTASDFNRASAARFIKLCATVIDDCTKTADKLGPYGYVADMLTRLQEMTAEFKTASVKPRNAIVEKSVATDQLAGLFYEAVAILENKTDRLMLQFRDSEPELYSEYVKARILEGPAVRKHERGEGAEGGAAAADV